MTYTVNTKLGAKGSTGVLDTCDMEIKIVTLRNKARLAQEELEAAEKELAKIQNSVRELNMMIETVGAPKVSQNLLDMPLMNEQKAREVMAFRVLLSEKQISQLKSNCGI